MYFDKYHGEKIDPHIYVSHDNNLFSSPDNKHLYGKSQKDIDSFDTLFYITPDIEEPIIPPNVKNIKKSYLEFSCLKFTDDSQIETIEARFIKLTKIFIPKNLQNFDQNLFKDIKEIEILPSNTRYTYLDNKYLLKKSDIENESFDELVWVNRSVNDILIPKCVKRIYPHAIMGFKSLSFEEGSMIKIIDTEAIDPMNGMEQEIVFPPSVELIKPCAVRFSQLLRSIVFKSEEITIEKDAFYFAGEPYPTRFEFPNAKKITYNDCLPEWYVVLVRRDAELRGTLFEEDHFNPKFYDDIIVSKEKLEQLFEYVRSIEKQLSETKEIKPYDLDSLIDKDNK